LNFELFFMIKLHTGFDILIGYYTVLCTIYFDIVHNTVQWPIYYTDISKTENLKSYDDFNSKQC
jgi:hypothetical protein